MNMTHDIYDDDDDDDDDDENFWGDAVGVGLLMSEILVALSVTPALTAATIIERRHDDDQGDDDFHCIVCNAMTDNDLNCSIARVTK